jgi:heme-degrading monooxygenase HmoA
MTAVETIRFRLREGVADSDFLRRNRGVEDNYMSRRPGFRSRETARGEDGEWLVVVHWDSGEAAQATMGAFFAAPEAQEFLDAVDKASASSVRYELVDY